MTTSFRHLCLTNTMRIFFLLLAIVTFSISASAIDVRSSGSYFVTPTHINERYADGATKIIQHIMETLGLQASFAVKPANVPNAAAVMYQGKRYILYNPSFIAAMNKAAGTPWAAIAVLAHEIGHHLNGHTLDGRGSLPDLELEADKFSGFVLRKLGASLAESQVAMKLIAGAEATRTHPGRTDRLMAIKDGWNKADDQLANREAPKPRQFDPEVTPEPEPLLESKYISFDVHFNFDPRAKYHVTVRNNLVKLLEDRVEVLGKFVTTGKTSFPFAFQTGDEDYLFITKEGTIYNEQGKFLGYIAPRK